MSAIQQLLTNHIDIWTAAEIEKKSGRGRGAGNAVSVYGIKKLRELILNLAVRGMLVPQDSNDEPAGELLKQIQTEKTKLIIETKVKKDKATHPIADEDLPFTLPQGWNWVRLGEITNFGTTVKLDRLDNNVWVLDLEDIEKDTSKLIQKVRFSDRNSLSDKNSFRKGDVLYGKLRPYLNKVIVADEDGVCTTEILPIRCYGKFSSHYFKTALKSPYFLKYVNARSYGMKMPRLGTEDGRQAPFPLPPLAEQVRIVAKVDELMALCDQLEAQHSNAAEAHEQLVSHLLGTLTQSQSTAEFTTNWQRIAAHFDTLFTTEASIDALKQTLLQLAVMGKLVVQDADDEPASRLLIRIQAERAKLIAEGKIKKDKQVAPIGNDEKPFQLPQNWEWVSFDNIAENSKHALKAGPFGSALKKDMYCENGYKIYGQEQVISGDEDLGDYYINEAKFRELSSCAVKSGDILISLVGTIGRVLVLSEKCEEGIINPRLVKISLFSEINRHFMKIIFASPLLKNEMANKSHGGTMDILNLGLLRAFALPLPPINEQHRIVTKVNELMEFCDQLRSRITAANQQQKKLANVLVEHAVIG